MKNSADQGGCYPQRPKVEADNTLRDNQDLKITDIKNFKVKLLLIYNSRIKTIQSSGLLSLH